MRQESEQQHCGRFRLIRVIGRGGMGTVYLAERADGEVTQRAAIKFLRHGGDDPAFQTRFLRERQILAALSHPGIARIIDAGHDGDGRPYLAMDYIDGVPIDVYAEKLDLNATLTLFLQVCGAVAYAHRNLIIHRDLKPSNILVDTSGRPKLLDFGIAKMMEEGGGPSAAQTQDVDRLSTPSYASPEQLRGAAQTTATDVYSLGAVLHKLLVGRPPWPAPDAANRSLPADLRFVLGKALRSEPEDRYPSVGALSDDLRAFLEGRPVRVRSEDAWYRAHKFLRRHRLPVAAAFLALAGLAVGLYIADREGRIAQRRFVQVRQLASQYIGLDRGVRGLSNSTQARNRIVSDSLAYLVGLSAEARGDRDLAVDIGAAYLQVARIQGVPVDSHLGQFDQAEENLRKADAYVGAALAADPANRRALLISAQIAHDRMVLAIMQDRREFALSQAGRMETQFSLWTRGGKPTPDQAADAAVLSRAIQFAREYRTGGDSAAAHSPQRAGGRLVAWGSEANLPPHEIDISGALEVAAGWHHTLALKSNGTVWSWGDNSYGQLGISGESRDLPVQVSRLSEVANISRGQSHSLALKADGTVWTWGWNFNRRPTDITNSALPLPVQVPGLSGVVAVSGSGGHALALRADGTVWAWGGNSNGQASDGKLSVVEGRSLSTSVPVQVSRLRDVVAISAGGAHSLAVKSDGTVWAWGFNLFGQLGNGSNDDSWVPVRVPGLVKVIAVAGGDHYSLALKADGTVWSWGRNREGELGNGANTASNLPVWVSCLSHVVAITAASARGPGHSLALKSDGTVAAWGYNAYGQLGSGGNTDSNVPIPVPGVSGAVAIGAGGVHSVAVVR